MDDEQLQSDLEEMSGSAAFAKQLKEDLRRLASGVAGKDLAEMANEILNGRMRIRDVARHSAYATYLIEGIDRFQRWQEQLTSDERDQLIADAQDRLLDQGNTQQSN